MEALSVKTLPPLTNNNFPVRRGLLKSNFSDGGVVGLSLNHKIIPGIGHSRMTACSKSSLYQDFQDFARPKRVLPATSADFCTQQKLENLFKFTGLGESCFYILQLQTSNEFESDIQGENSAILVCLIDASNNAVLQRIPVPLTEDGEIGNCSSSCRQIHFQRGSVDTVTFSGPVMEKIEALWIGLESGSWRLGNLRLTVISKNASTLSEDSSDIHHNGLHYDFTEKDVLLGEGGGTSVAELRPEHVMEFPVYNSISITDISHPWPSLFSKGISNAQGMKEYADLKLSLLIYDTLLVSAGATILTFSTNEKFALAFLLGGISGLLFLLSLQKSVDDLPSSTLPPTDGKVESIFGALFNGPLSRLALLLVIFAAVFKYGAGDSSVDSAPYQLLIASLGFFTCKIAVLLAAFKPLEINVK